MCSASEVWTQAGCCLTRRGSSPQQRSGGCTWASSARRWRSGCSLDQEPDQGDLRTGREHWTHFRLQPLRSQSSWSLIGCSSEWGGGKWAKQADNHLNTLPHEIHVSFGMISWFCFSLCNLGPSGFLCWIRSTEYCPLVVWKVQVFSEDVRWQKLKY